MIALIVAVRLALYVSVVTLIHHLRVDIATLLDTGCESLNAQEVVQDTARRTRSNSIRHIKDLFGDLRVPKRHN
jgi:hypothetical protein